MSAAEGHALQRLHIDGIDVEVQGRGPTALLMLHGWPDTASVWDPQVEALREQARCVRFTLPGFDRGHPRRAYAIEEIVATIARIADAVTPERPLTLMLHDWGCVFGYRYAQAYPDRVAAIVAIDVGDAGSREHLAELPWQAKAGMAVYQLLLAAAWHLPGRAGGDALTRRIARWARAPGAAAEIGAHMNYPYHVQWTRGYGRRPFVPHCPMLYVWGSRKPFLFHSHAWLQALEARPGCSMQAFPTGHWVPHEAPDAFNRVVVEWLMPLVR